MINLWEFPESDFLAWQQLVGAEFVRSFSDYQTILAAVQGDLERSGHNAVRVRLSVAEMVEMLDAKDWPNTPYGRAQVLAGWSG